MSVDFTEHDDGTMVGTGGRGRQWRVLKTVSGWRLEFRDEGDDVATYAGTHRSLESAMSQAD